MKLRAIVWIINFLIKQKLKLYKVIEKMIGAEVCVISGDWISVYSPLEGMTKRIAHGANGPVDIYEKEINGIRISYYVPQEEAEDEES